MNCGRTESGYSGYKSTPGRNIRDPSRRKGYMLKVLTEDDWYVDDEEDEIEQVALAV
jgi:hypothetical protein